MIRSRSESAGVIPPVFLSGRAFWESLPPGELPTRCSQCGSKEISPLFWPDPSIDEYQCYEPTCMAIFGWRD